jgi:hypothetical protein
MRWYEAIMKKCKDVESFGSDMSGAGALMIRL